LDFSNNNDMFAMGGGDGVVRVFNLIHDVWDWLTLKWGVKNLRRN
jgi:hypothetical protein